MTSHRIGVNLRVSGNCDQGERKYMEDNHAIKFVKKDNRDYEFAYFGIFDGHGGPEASRFARDNLLNEITKYDQFWNDIDEDVLFAIKSGFLDTHQGMWKELDNWPRTPSGLPSTSGTTASIAIIKQGKLYIGHAGDSGIVLGCDEGPRNAIYMKPKCLTKDHKPDSPEERARIEKSGGSVVAKCGVQRVVWSRPRVNHKGPVRRSTQIDKIPFLAVARSLGDLWSYDYYKGQFVVSPEPDVSVMKLEPGRHRCLILGSDGMWNMISAAEAVSVVIDLEMHFEDRVIHDPSVSVSYWINPAERLVARALNKWRLKMMKADNISCIVVLIDPLGPSKLTILRKRREEYFQQLHNGAEDGFSVDKIKSSLSVPETSEGTLSTNYGQIKPNRNQSNNLVSNCKGNAVNGDKKTSRDSTDGERSMSNCSGSEKKQDVAAVENNELKIFTSGNWSTSKSYSSDTAHLPDSQNISTRSHKHDSEAKCAGSSQGSDKRADVTLGENNQIKIYTAGRWGMVKSYSSDAGHTLESQHKSVKSGREYINVEKNTCACSRGSENKKSLSADGNSQVKVYTTGNWSALKSYSSDSARVSDSQHKISRNTSGCIYYMDSKMKQKKTLDKNSDEEFRKVDALCRFLTRPSISNPEISNQDFSSASKAARMSKIQNQVSVSRHAMTHRLSHPLLRPQLTSVNMDDSIQAAAGLPSSFHLTFSPASQNTKSDDTISGFREKGSPLQSKLSSISSLSEPLLQLMNLDAAKVSSDLVSNPKIQAGSMFNASLHDSHMQTNGEMDVEVAVVLEQKRLRRSCQLSRSVLQNSTQQPKHPLYRKSTGNESKNNTESNSPSLGKVLRIQTSQRSELIPNLNSKTTIDSSCKPSSSSLKEKAHKSSKTSYTDQNTGKSKKRRDFGLLHKTRNTIRRVRKAARKTLCPENPPFLRQLPGHKRKRDNKHLMLNTPSIKRPRRSDGLQVSL